MKQHFDRLWWDIAHLFSNEANPYVLNGQGGFTGARRTGFEDLFHALKNIPVEYMRMRKSK